VSESIDATKILIDNNFVIELGESCEIPSITNKIIVVECCVL